MELGLAIAFCIAFALTNGFHDAANAIATLVATRGARPGQAIVLAAVFNMLGALLVGTAVADTIAGIVTVAADEAVAVIGAGVLAATLWNLLTWWRGLPSSSAHALVGGLVGSAFAEAGIDAIHWGGLDGWQPVGVFGVLIVLAVSPLLGLGFGFAFARLDARLLRRATRAVDGPIRARRVGDVRRALVRPRRQRRPEGDGRDRGAAAGQRPPRHARRCRSGSKLACGAALTLGTAMGGWRIIRTIGRRIFRLAPIDGFASQSASTAVILAASYRRRAGLDHAGGRLVGGRRRRRPAALAPRALGGGALDRLRLAAARCPPPPRSGR